MSESNKMSSLGESIHDCQNNRFAIHLGQSFNEIHCYIRPNGGWNVQRLQETPGLQVLTFVTLASGTGTNKILHHHAIIGNVEVSS